MFKSGGLTSMLMPRTTLSLDDGGGGGDKKVVTQEEVDKVFSMYKRTDETLKKVVDKLDKSEGEKVELITRISELEKKKKDNTYVPPPPPDEDEDEVTKKYNENNFPKNDKEWNELYDANPNKAMDLKGKVQNVNKVAMDEHNKDVGTLMEKHADMYKKDTAGNLVFDADSEKGKVWNGLANKDPNILRIRGGTIMLMNAMENKMRGSTDDKVKQELEAKKNAEEEARVNKVKAGQLAGGGGTPPEDKDIKIEYNSDEEKAHVQKKINQGVYKTEKDYFKVKKSVVVPYGRGGF